MISNETEINLEDTLLWRQCAEGSEEAREKLILANRPMVYWLAKKLKVPYNTYQDIIQEGMLALINAVDTFDVNRNIRFSTYAYYKIHGRMINFLQRVEARAPIPVDSELLADDGTEHMSGGADRREWSIDLENALSHLSDRESEIIKALILQGRIAREVADDKAIDISNVYRIKKRALAKLKSWFGYAEADSPSEL